jgi:hypothetical protein
MRTGPGGDEPLVVRVPDEVPVLNRAASRILLHMLIERTTVPVLDEPAARGRYDD